MNPFPLRLSSALCALTATAALCGPAVADEPLVVSYGRLVTAEEAAATIVPATVPGPGEWGTSSSSILVEGACGSVTRDPSHTFQIPNCARVEPIGTGPQTTTVGWNLHLPTGAQILGARLHYFDNMVGEPSVAMYQINGTGALNLILDLTPPAFTGGNATFVANLATPHTVVNTGSGYQILAIIGRSSSTTLQALYSVEVLYRLQVSPGPATATFPSDVPVAHPFFKFVEAMAAAGITGGCAPNSFCPDQAVTRGQLAVFLSTALGLHFPN